MKRWFRSVNCRYSQTLLHQRIQIFALISHKQQQASICLHRKKERKREKSCKTFLFICRRKTRNLWGRKKIFGCNMKGWFDAFRDDGAPTLYSFSNRTPVIGDISIIVVFILFATLYTAFLVIFPGVRKQVKSQHFCDNLP